MHLNGIFRRQRNKGSVTNRAFTNRINFNNERKITELEQELCNTVKASITDIPIHDITNLLAYFLPKDDHFVKEYNHYKERTNHPKQTERLQQFQCSNR